MHPPLKMAFAATLAAGAALAAAAGFAQDYPVKPVRFITGNPGATADILARHLGAGLAKRWQQPVVVDNRGGAAAMISADLAAKAPSDGHTLLMGQLNSHGIAVNLYRNLPYDPVKDFVAITRVASVPQVLIVHPSVPATSVREFIDHARKRSGTLDYASSGNGTSSHLTTELFRQRTGLDLVHIQYKGGAAATRSIMSGETKVAFVLLSTGWNTLTSGKVRALAIASRQRVEVIPDVPTFDEAGLQGFESTAWFGVFAPARTPQSIVKRVNREIVDILRTPSVQRDLMRLGTVVNPGTPEEFSVFIGSEIVKWRDVIKTAGIQPQ